MCVCVRVCPLLTTRPGSPLPHCRMQVARSTKRAHVGYSTFPSALKTVYTDGGVTGLWKGAGARVAFFAPATGVQMTVFEAAMRYLEGR